MNTQTIDPRIAAAGGTPQGGDDGRHGYNYPGMMSARHWAATKVHGATTYYGCAWCNQKFKGPHAVYTHIAKVHPSKAAQPRGTARVGGAESVPVADVGDSYQEAA